MSLPAGALQPAAPNPKPKAKKKGGSKGKSNQTNAEAVEEE